jgi:hypothetical protein
MVRRVTAVTERSLRGYTRAHKRSGGHDWTTSRPFIEALPPAQDHEIIRIGYDSTAEVFLMPLPPVLRAFSLRT